jgi:hypothetical protein
MCKEEQFRPLTILYSILFQQEEALKAVRDIHPVHTAIADLLLHITADRLALSQEVPILPGHHLFHHQVHHQVHHLVHHLVHHQGLHQEGDSPKTV